MWNKNWNPRTIVTGCSFGAYHALNFAMRHPDKVTDCVSMGGSFDIKRFLNGWYSEDAYFNNPPDYLAIATTAGAITTFAPCFDWRMGHVLERQQPDGGDHGLARYSPRNVCLGRPELPRLAVVAPDGTRLPGIVCSRDPNKRPPSRRCDQGGHFI